MMDAGRIKHHLINNLESEQNAVLIIGYCEPSTLGGKILRGDKVVSIYGQQVQVQATIYQLDYYSAHADYNEILTYLKTQNPLLVKQLFLVHGNKNALVNLKDLLYENSFSNVQIAEQGKLYEI